MNFTDDRDKKAYRKKWAQLNLGRVVIVADDSEVVSAFRGGSGPVVGIFKLTGHPYIETESAFFFGSPGRDFEFFDDRHRTETTGTYCAPADMKAIDGLGPFILPIRAPDGSWQAPTIGNKCRHGFAISERSPECAVCIGERFKERFKAEDAAKKAPVANAATAPDLHAAATRALIFLAELVPMPNWSKETERELRDCYQALKAAVRVRK